MRASIIVWPLGLALASTLVSPTDHPERIASSGCHPGTIYRESVRRFAGQLAASSTPADQALRVSIGLPTLSSPDDAVAISTDSLCVQAANALSVYLHVPTSTSRSMFLIRVGSRYWAEDPAVGYAGITQAFILDSTRTTVVGTTNR